jgi:trk system potassium uptake protein TrkA
MLGVDVTVSQTDYILTLIEQAIPDQPFIHLVNLIHEDMAIVDAKVVPGSKIANRTIGDIPVPQGCIIAAIIRGGELIIPSPSTEVKEGDDVIAVAHRAIEEDLRKLLAKQNR